MEFGKWEVWADGQIVMIRLEDESSDSSFPLHYPGREARCNMVGLIIFPFIIVAPSWLALIVATWLDWWLGIFWFLIVAFVCSLVKWWLQPDCNLLLVLESMCLLQESSIPSTCLTAEGELSITATPGLRFRLRVKAVLPLECPATKAEDYCPQVSAIFHLNFCIARAPVVALKTAHVSIYWAPRSVSIRRAQAIIFGFYSRWRWSTTRLAIVIIV